MEQLCFGDELNIDMNIETTNFKLPPLTIQPLVENAVKWGGASEEGITVRVSAYDTPLGTEVVVFDDGVGFDPEHLPQDGKEHLGLKLVHNRLQMFCGAKLTVDSKIGQGTVVRVFIPHNLD